jgi:hypothetical protein
MADRNDVVTEISTNAQNINYVLVAGLGILLVAFLAKLARKEQIEIYKISLDVKKIPLIMLGFTLAHFYVGYVFNSAVRHTIAGPNIAYAVDAFDQLQRNGPLFFKGLVARLEFVRSPMGPVFIMKASDPTTLLAHAAAVGAFFVMIRWKGISAIRRFASIVMSGVIVGANWLIGGGWAVHASCLSRATECKQFLGL